MLFVCCRCLHRSKQFYDSPWPISGHDSSFTGGGRRQTDQYDLKSIINIDVCLRTHTHARILSQKFVSFDAERDLCVYTDEIDRKKEKTG